MNDGLRDEWLAFELEEFPPECAGRVVNGRLWEEVDAVVAACISTGLSEGTLDPECRALLEDALTRLEAIAAAAEEGCRPYFSRLLDLGRRIRAEAKPANPP